MKYIFSRDYAKIKKRLNQKCQFKIKIFEKWRASHVFQDFQISQFSLKSPVSSMIT